MLLVFLSESEVGEGEEGDRWAEGQGRESLQRDGGDAGDSLQLLLRSVWGEGDRQGCLSASWG